MPNVLLPWCVRLEAPIITIWYAVVVVVQPIWKASARERLYLMSKPASIRWKTSKERETTMVQTTWICSLLLWCLFKALWAGKLKLEALIADAPAPVTWHMLYRKLVETFVNYFWSLAESWSRQHNLPSDDGAWNRAIKIPEWGNANTFWTAAM